MKTPHTIFAWMLLTIFLMAFVVILILDNIQLRDELAKPAKITLEQRHKIIQDYFAVGENRWALRQTGVCKE